MYGVNTCAGLHHMAGNIGTGGEIKQSNAPDLFNEEPTCSS